MIASLWDLLWNAPPQGRVVNAVILLLFACGVTLAARQWARWRREDRVLAPLLAKPPDPDAVVERPTNLPMLFYTLGLYTADTPNSPKTAVGRRARDVWLLRGAGQTGVDALAEVFAAREEASVESPRYLTSVLVLVGLAGTIWGLHGLLGGLLGAGDDYQTLVRALQPMKTAFSCTFLGILTSVALAGMLTAAENAQTGFAARLEEFVAVRVIPLVFPPSPAAQLDQMAAILAESGRFAREFGVAVQGAQTAFSETLERGMETAAERFEASMHGAGRALETTLQNAAGQVESTVKRLSESMAAVTAAYERLGEAAQSIEDYRAALEEEHAKFHDLLEATNEGVLRNVRETTEPLKAAAEQMRATAESVAALRDGFAEERAERREDMRLFAEGAASVRQAAERVTGDLDGIARAAAHAAARADELLATVKPELLRLPNGETLKEALLGVARGLEGIGRRLDAAGRGLESAAALASVQNEQLAVLRQINERAGRPVWRRWLADGRTPPDGGRA